MVFDVEADILDEGGVGGLDRLFGDLHLDLTGVGGF